MMEEMKIVELITKDIRFPTSLEGDGSDPMVRIFCVEPTSANITILSKLPMKQLDIGLNPPTSI